MSKYSPLLPNGYVDIDRLLAMYVAAGIDADILPGAHTRAARLFVAGGYVNGVRGLDRHHTAQHESMSEMASINYMTFWAPYPVMTNTYPWKDGRLTICAAGPTYTAGSGGPLGEITYGNEQMWSMEIGNNGIGEPYPAAQQETILKATAVEVEFFGSGIWEEPPLWWRVPAHFEWTPRKIDPWGPSRWTNNQNIQWPMDAFRADVLAARETLFDTDPTIPGEAMEIYEVDPYRASDTRVWPKVKLTPGERYRYGVGSGVPKDARMVVATVTAANPDGAGHVSVNIPGGELFKTSCLNFKEAGGAIANTTFIPVRNGQYDIASSVETHVIVDVLGYAK